MAVFRLVCNDSQVPPFCVPEGESTIGRDSAATLCISQFSISRIHAKLLCEGESLSITDQGSRNGTSVNGQRLAPYTSYGLRQGDVVKLCSTEFSIQPVGPTANFYRPGQDKADPTLFIPLMIVERRDPEESPSTDPGSTSFGFDSNTVVFVKEGIERTTANNISRKYKFVDLLKKGGMGRIFLVQEVLSGRFVALKVMAESMISSVPHVQQFVREAVITARLQHPHVIPVHDLGFVDGHKLYYTMRYVNGKSLTQLIGVVGARENLTALRRAASAVHYAHSLGLWHRDLKPDNILVDRSGEVFVIDWGLVSVQPGRSYALDIPEVVINRQSYSYQDRLIEETESAITAYTASGERRVLIGTPAYMAPEQCANHVETMGQASDVWAFGVMLYEILTGEHPIPGHKHLTPLDLVEHVQRLSIPSLLGEAGTRYPELSEVCLRMLAPSPSEREQSLQPLIDTVDRVLGSPI